MNATGPSEPRRFIGGQCFRVLVLAVVVAVIAGVSGALVFLAPTVVPEVRFHVERDAYRLGQAVELVLENRHTRSFCHGGVNPWSVYRLINDTWQRVEVHEDTAAFYLVAPGESRRWSWKAENDTERVEFGLAEVIPGRYLVDVSGALCESVTDPDATPVPLSAAFLLTD